MAEPELCCMEASALGWPGAWAPNQKLMPTYGCCRAHNIDLRDKVLPLTKQGTSIYISFPGRLVQ
jgi:hypothetical protein